MCGGPGSWCQGSGDTGPRASVLEICIHVSHSHACTLAGGWVPFPKPLGPSLLGKVSGLPLASPTSQRRPQEHARGGRRGSWAETRAVPLLGAGGGGDQGRNQVTAGLFP